MNGKTERTIRREWAEILRSGARFPCGDCGQMVLPAEHHTWEDCRAYERAEAERSGDAPASEGGRSER